MEKNTNKPLVLDWGDDFLLDEEAQEALLQETYQAHGAKLTPQCIAALEAV